MPVLLSRERRLHANCSKIIIPAECFFSRSPLRVETISYTGCKKHRRAITHRTAMNSSRLSYKIGLNYNRLFGLYVLKKWIMSGIKTVIQHKNTLQANS